MGITFPGESPEYRAAREQLLQGEIALRRATEELAAARRELPPGVIRHFWGSELLYAQADAGEDPRHVGTIEPLWNLLDLTREGRPADWYEQLSY
jgi:predicted dithiol-disulfide oxidoreductase (DUF899 family)